MDAGSDDRGRGGCEVVRFPPERNTTIDAFRRAKRRLDVATLVELDARC
jgi:hypothetical protein